MLEVKDLYKVYKPKRGVPVVAVNHISLKFPDTGMVFLLGKSGSGKSTMLNLLGGLDTYNGGEIIIKGVSSKNFKQKHFDSYRNTYVGFIFQEYNILDEFSVGANIALALELQGQKATNEKINEILQQVDLDGYGNRKPNELSGGQKQRVAIARALIKNPEIIMADEPTGALDSNTGKQVFDTLKKLSKDKLVIIVSHDREFSEQYADRIIELADGNVISDVELDGELDENGEVTEIAEEKTQETVSLQDASGHELTVSPSLSLDGNQIAIEAGYHLTEADRVAINAYMDMLEKKENLILTKKVHRYRNVHFKPTDQSKIAARDGHDFKLIKSKLPMKAAFRIGANGLKYKKVKLVFTIILSVVAFSLFGLADTFGAYDHVKACVDSLQDSDINYVSLAKAVKIHYNGGDEDDFYWSSSGNKISAEELSQAESDTGIPLKGVFVPRSTSLSFASYIQRDKLADENSYYTSYMTEFNGYVELSEEELSDFGYTLVAGSMPDGTKDEIAISAYLCETFIAGGYSTNEGKSYTTIGAYKDMVGRTLTLGDTTYTITGVVDTGMDFERYDVLNRDMSDITTAQMILYYALENEMDYAASYSVTGTMIVGKGYVENLVAAETPISEIIGYVSADFWSEDSESEIYLWPDYGTTLSCVQEAGLTVNWLDGERTSLKDNEVIIFTDALEYWGYEELTEAMEACKGQTFTGYASAATGNDGNVEWTIVGYVESSEAQDWCGTVVLSDADYKAFCGENDGTYDYLVGPMPQTRSGMTDIVNYTLEENAEGETRYVMKNAVTYELETINEVVVVLSKVFLYIGIGFAVFAALMLSNFIATSISYKKQEIGILRAIGSRSNDVFRIFFSESFIIAMINFVVSCVGVGAVTAIVNRVIRMDVGILITVLHFGIRQVVLILLVSLAVAAVASFIPVKKIASKKPIDAIRNR